VSDWSRTYRLFLTTFNCSSTEAQDALWIFSNHAGIIDHQTCGVLEV